MNNNDVKHRLDMIKQVTERIRLLSEKQYLEYQNMLSVLDIPDDQHEKLHDLLFDYCYN